MNTIHTLRNLALFALMSLTLNAAAFDNALRLSITGNGNTDQAIVRYHVDGSNEFDPSLEAYKMFSPNNSVPSIYTRIEGSYDVTINALPLNEMYSSVVPVYTKISDAGTYTITAQEVGMFYSNISILIEDLVTGEMVYFRNGETYTFTHDGCNTGDCVEQRFVLHFKTNFSFTSVDASCFEMMDAVVSITADHHELWDAVLLDSQMNVISNITLSDNQHDFDGLGKGNYYVQLTHPEFGLVLGSYTVQEPAQIASDFETEVTSSKNGQQVAFENTSLNGVSYHWNFDDGAVSTEDNPIHEFSPGSYNVELTTSNGACSQTTNKWVDIESTTDVSPSLVSVVNVFPNPATDQLNVQMTNAVNAEYTMYNLSGQAVAIDVNNNGSGAQIGIQDLDPGAYVLVVLNGGERVEQSIIKLP